MTAPATWVVLPTLNEAGALPTLLNTLRTLPELGVWGVDDASTDGTAAIWDAAVRADPEHVRVLHRPARLGLGTAYTTAFRHPAVQSADWVVQMDADGSHRPADLVRLLAARPQGDLLIGSRYVAGGKTPGWPWHRRGLSRAGSFYSRALLGVPVSDLTGGFKVWRTDLLARMPWDQITATGYGFQIATTAWAYWLGARVVEVPITFIDRQTGVSKFSGAMVTEALGLVWALRRRHRRAIASLLTERS